MLLDLFYALIIGMITRITTSLRRLSAKLARVSLISWITTLAVLLLTASLSAWLYYSHTNANKVFWGMVETNLRTESFTKTITSNDGGQVTTQVLAAQTAPRHITNGIVTIEYPESGTKVVTENIGTPYVDYIRYKSIETNQKSTTGGKLDFSAALNVWGKQEPQSTVQTAAKETSAQQYSEAVFGIVPMGNVSPDKRAQIMASMKANGVYTVSLAGISYQGLLRRPVLTLNVAVNTAGYISVLKSYAAAVGLNHLEAVDPSQFASDQPVTVQIDVDGWSYGLREIRYPDGSRVETFAGFGVVNALPGEPKDSIAIDELRSRLQSVQ